MAVSFPKTELSAVIARSDGPLDPILLGSFIKNFATLHNAIARCAKDDDELQEIFLDYDLANGIAPIRSAIVTNAARRRMIARLYFAEHGSWLRHQKGQDDDKWLKIVSVQKNSPFQWAVYGLVAALTGAVIFSGGHLKVGAIVEADLPSLGTGLQSIRDGMQGGNIRIAPPEQRQIRNP